MEPAGIIGRIDLQLLGIDDDKPREIRVTVKEDLTKLHDLLEKRDVQAVLEDEKLFWQLFCLSYANNKSKIDKFILMSLNISLVESLVEGKKVQIVGDEPTLFREQRAIEELRKILIGKFAQGEDITLFEHTDGSSFGCWTEFFFLDSATPSVAYKSNDESINSLCDAFASISPVLPEMVEHLGGTYASAKESHTVRFQFDGLRKRELTLHKIKWGRDEHYVYPIPPKKLPERDYLKSDLYELYQQKICCDFTIQIGNESIGVHSALLYRYGGDFFKRLFVPGFKEMQERAIQFDHVSKSTILAFLDYVYLGPKELLQKLKFPDVETPFDVQELLVFACNYQIEPLIDCCTNLMSQTMTADDVKAIEEMATRFDNLHLHALAVHFKEKRD